MSVKLNYDASTGSLLRQRYPVGACAGGYMFACENSSSITDMIAFVDGVLDNQLTYILQLGQKFENDSKSLPKDRYGNVRTQSLKAWIKRNDTRNMLETEYRCGKINWRFGGFIYTVYAGNTYVDFVKEVFHKTLCLCAEAEQKYEREHNEYYTYSKVLSEKMRKYGTAFGVLLCEVNGVVYLSDTQNKKYRQLSMEEIKSLLAAYEKLDNEIKQIEYSISIKY